MTKKTEQPTPETENTAKSHNKELLIGSIVIVVVLAIIASIIFAINSSSVKVVYQPSKACELLTIEEARELLGSKAIMTGMTEPAMTGNTATSKCGYTDGNADTDKIIVAAIMVRSGVNDNGVEQNKTQFTNGRPVEDTELVEGLGDAAYFNNKKGQLNILDGFNWIVISYGLGNSLETNTLEDAIEVGKKVVATQ